MLRAALDGQRYEMLNLDPFTLSTFDTRNVLDFTQTDVAFVSPELPRRSSQGEGCSRQSPGPVGS